VPIFYISAIERALGESNGHRARALQNLLFTLQLIQEPYSIACQHLLKKLFTDLNSACFEPTTIRSQARHTNRNHCFQS